MQAGAETPTHLQSQQPSSISDIALDAFISEATADVNGAISTVHLVGQFTTGFYAFPSSVEHVEYEVRNNAQASRFLSNYMSVLFMRINEVNGTNIFTKDNLIDLVSKSVNPFPMDDSDDDFIKERFPLLSETISAFRTNPFALIMAILRINLDKLLIIAKFLGTYISDFENDDTQKSQTVGTSMI